MQNLDLDFCKIRPASPWIRWGLLALALAFTADLGVSYSGARNAMAENEKRLASTGRTAHASRAARLAPAPSPDEIRVARDTFERLALPWDGLFTAIESTASEKVALLAIEPEPKSGKVVISGEAVDYRAALDYVSKLGSAGTLRQPHLIRHERRQDRPGQALAFSISASWSGTQ